MRLALVRVPGFGATGFSTGIAIGVLTHWDDRERHGQAILNEINRRLGEVSRRPSFRRHAQSAGRWRRGRPATRFARARLRHAERDGGRYPRADEVKPQCLETKNEL